MIGLGGVEYAMSEMTYEFRQIAPITTVDVEREAKTFLQATFPELPLEVKKTKNFWPILVSEVGVANSAYVNGFLVHGDTPPIVLNPDSLPTYADALVAYSIMLEDWIRHRGGVKTDSPMTTFSFPQEGMTQDEQNKFLMRLQERKTFILRYLVRKIVVDIQSEEILQVLARRAIWPPLPYPPEN